MQTWFKPMIHFILCIVAIKIITYLKMDLRSRCVYSDQLCEFLWKFIIIIFYVLDIKTETISILLHPLCLFSITRNWQKVEWWSRGPIQNIGFALFSCNLLPTWTDNTSSLIDIARRKRNFYSNKIKPPLLLENICNLDNREYFTYKLKHLYRTQY